MVTLESRVRQLDNPLEDRRASIRRIALELNAKESTVRTYVSAARAGYASYYERQKAQYAARGMNYRDSVNLSMRKLRDKYGDHHRRKAHEAYGFESEYQLKNFRKGKATGRVQDPFVMFLPGNSYAANVAFRDVQEYFSVSDEALATSLQRLPPAEQEIIRLEFWEGESLTEIGKKFRVTGEAVRQRRNKWLNRLRELIQSSLS